MTEQSGAQAVTQLAQDQKIPCQLGGGMTAGEPWRGPCIGLPLSYPISTSTCPVTEPPGSCIADAVGRFVGRSDDRTGLRQSEASNKLWRLGTACGCH